MTDRALARPIVSCLLSALLFGASMPIAKRLLDGAGPVTLAGLFCAGAALGVRRGTVETRRSESAGHTGRSLQAVTSVKSGRNVDRPDSAS